MKQQKHSSIHPQDYITELNRVFNLTGVVLHTGLGRAPLSGEALRAMRSVGRAATVEIGADSGKRGQRQDIIARRCRKLFGLSGAAFNNNAAATLLTLAATTAGKEVIVGLSRLVAIGGSFAMPAVMEQSGAILREVGTVNQTTVADYEKAINSATGAIFVAHRSNFRLEGDYTEPTLTELAELAHRHNLPFIYDQGSGLVDSHHWSGSASTVRGAIEAGCDLISFSGDKLLGGPQAGIVIGRDDLVAACAKHPLARAFRLDKTILAGLAATLDSYLENRGSELPTLRLLSLDRVELHRRAENLAEQIGDSVPDGFSLSVVETVGRAGSGALPMVDLPGAALSFTHKRISMLRRLARKLRLGGIFGRLTGSELLLDPRALPEDEEAEFLTALKSVLEGL